MVWKAFPSHFDEDKQLGKAIDRSQIGQSIRVLYEITARRNRTAKLIKEGPLVDAKSSPQADELEKLPDVAGSHTTPLVKEKRLTLKS